jgi:uroporphyrinogen decarboxylase
MKNCFYKGASRMKFEPNYHNMIKVANNIEPHRIPLYDHSIDKAFLANALGVNLDPLFNSYKTEDIRNFFKIYCGFFKNSGYDTVSFEMCIAPHMPGSGSLAGHKPGVIKNRSDFENYPWDQIEDIYFEKVTCYFELLREEMPKGMKAIGGPGNGIFECVQDIVGYQSLCLIKMDDPELYQKLFEKVGSTNLKIWKKFLDNFSDLYAVCRFGDDLGYKSSTLLSPEDICNLIIPQYKRIIDLIHSYDRPFLLHSCGKIFDVMDALIEAGIDAKHSNEDIIAPFKTWIQKYGTQIGNFGGIDMDVLCQKSPEEIRTYTFNILEESAGNGGIAIGSGNSVPRYVPVEGYMAMNKAIREFRGE